MTVPSAPPSIPELVEVPGRLLPEGLKLLAVSLRGLTYQEVGPDEPDAPAATDGPTAYDINGAIDVRPPDLVQVAIKFNLRANPKERPIKLDVVLTANFRTDPSVNFGALVEFVRVRSHLILFPYLREVVSNVTGRGIYGPFYLDPVVLPPMMEKEEMWSYLEALSPSPSTVTSEAAPKTRAKPSKAESRKVGSPE